MLRVQGINNMTRGQEEDTWHMVGKLLQLYARSSPIFHQLANLVPAKAANYLKCP